MGISAVLNIASAGLQANARRLAATANNVANAGTPGYNRLETGLTSQPYGGVSASVSPSNGATLDDTSNVDLGSELIDMKAAEIGYKANAAVFETGADLWDVLMSIKKD